MKRIDDKQQLREVLDSIYHDQAFASLYVPEFYITAVTSLQGEFLRNVVERYRPDIFLEVGYGYGLSALWVQSARHPPKEHIIVDPFRPTRSMHGLYVAEQALKKRKGVTQIHDQTSQEYLAHFLKSGNRADMVFVDGSEWFDSVMTDMFFISRVLRTGGIVMIRNMWNPAVRGAVMFYIRNLPYTIEGWAPWEVWVVKNMRIIGPLYLRYKARRLDFCILRLTDADKRHWAHFVPYH